MLQAISRKFRTLLALPGFCLVWLVPVWLLLGVSRLLIKIVSFRRLAPYLGVLSGAAPWVPLLQTHQQSRARDIGRVVRLAARYTPWESNCFPQAVVARLLLGWYGIPYALYFGLLNDRGAAPLSAHAWVAAGPVQVTGGSAFHQFTVVGVFASPGPARS